jgi:hypothetical protein
VTSDRPPGAPPNGKDPTLPPPVPLQEQPTLPPTGPPARSAGALAGSFGRYVIERKLGEGGMGAVYLARDTQLDRPVALKVPFLGGPDGDALRARFLHEARAAAALRHPGICPTHDLGEIDGTPYLTMPYLTGEPLSRRLARGSLPVAEAVALVEKVARALHYAHERGVVHRDLKPGNVLLDEHGEPVVMDFGLARRAGDSHLTQEGEVMGTPAYMAPEQLGGQVAAMGPPADVYSLGVVLYELLTGAPPFQGDLLALASQIAYDEPRPPSKLRPGVDGRLDALCLKALAKRPADRPSMGELAAALADYREADRRAAAGIGAAPAQRGPAAGPVLALRVVGTPFVYRPAPGQETISVGRQRRAPGGPPDHGNDLVLRVAGDDAFSTRISRRHFGIVRAGGEYHVIDRSKAGLLLNGRALARNEPVPLSPGDRLLVAGVVELEVLLDQGGVVGFVAPVVHAPALARGTTQVLFEASMGDMVTVE